MKSILFVDDEPNVIEGLRRMLHGLRKEWDMSFALSGEEALKILSKKPVDVIVTDMRMPGMDGAQLLAEVQQLHPQVVRIILSGHSDMNLVLRSVRPAHQFLSKPCQPEKLKETVERAYRVREILSDPALAGIISQVDSLPSVPETYTQIMGELEKPNASLAQVGRIIARDIAMTAGVLKLVNSSFFGFVGHIESPLQAVNLLGVETIKGLVLSAHLFTLFDHRKFPGFTLEHLINHCLDTGRLAKVIAEQEGRDRKVADDCFIAGTLHDVGKLVLASKLEAEYARVIRNVQERNLTLWEVEKEVFGTTHAEVGAYLLGLWGLPAAIVDAVAFHHAPAKAGSDGFAVTAVHVANALEHDLYVLHEGYARNPLDTGHLAALGLSDRLPAWREACVRVSRVGQEP